jgi:hypothetical protein
MVRELEDWSEARATFDAAVYPSLVVASRGQDGAEPSANPAVEAGDRLPAIAGDRFPVGEGEGFPVAVAEHFRDQALRWEVPRAKLPYDATPGAPWLWLPPDARDGFDLLRTLGAPLAGRDGLRPRLGVKTGCNEAFIVPASSPPAGLEPGLLRPLLRGNEVDAWRIGPLAGQIIFPHDDRLQALRELPAGARRWLRPFRSRLMARTDSRGSDVWWALHRVDAADQRLPRVVWADMSRAPRAAVLPPGSTVVPLNTCYVVRTRTLEEAYALAAWMNSPLSAAWLAALAEPARGGFRRLLGWTVGLLPIPRDWERATNLLAPLGARGAAGDAPATQEMLDAALDAIGARPSSVEALVTWGHR